MAIASMTGFARSQGAAEGYQWAWELRSTNGRNLDIRLRVPPGFEMLEAGIRALAQKYLKRGSVNISLQCQRESGALVPVVNREALENIAAIAQELQASLNLAAPSVDGLLALKGVLETVGPEETEDSIAHRNAAMLDNLEAALTELTAMRQGEGGELAKVLTDTLSAMAEKTEEAANAAAAQPEAIRERFQARLEDLLAGQTVVDADRLAQEIAILAAKADVREEVDRLRAHIEAARLLLTEGGAIGRRMDFLAQEMNREANTMCAKSSDSELTGAGLALKTLIDQLREQIQNVE